MFSVKYIYTLVAVSVVQSKEVVLLLVVVFFCRCSQCLCIGGSPESFIRAGPDNFFFLNLSRQRILQRAI